MSLKQEQFISNRYGLIRILVAAHSVLILGLVLWMLSPNFRSIIKLDFSKNIPLSEKVIDSQGIIAKNPNGNSTNWQISLVSHGPIPSDQLLDSPSNIFQSYQYQYKVTSESSPLSGASRSHLVTVELYYGPNNGDLRHRLGIAFNDFTLKNLVILPKQNRYGWYGLFNRQQKTYLTSCINVRGSTTLDPEQFMANRNQYDLQLDRLPAYIMGLTHWRDHRCLWVVMHTPTVTADQSSVGSLPRLFARNSNTTNSSSESLALETLWQEIYPHWQQQIPPYKNQM